jgi:hypothetical protein
LLKLLLFRALLVSPSFIFQNFSNNIEQTSIVVSIAALSKQWNIAYTSVKHGVKNLERLKIISEVSGKQRNKLYVSDELLKIILPTKPSSHGHHRH